LKALPVGEFLKDGSQPHQLVLDEKRDNVGEVHLFLLAISKTGHVFTPHKRRALVGHVTKYAGRVADQSDRLAGIVELAQLEKRAGKYTLPYFQVQRAKMILLAAEGLATDQIAARLDTRREVVCFWRKRFFSERLAGLEERSRPGRPRTFSP
jgi:hypothetical protein